MLVTFLGIFVWPQKIVIVIICLAFRIINGVDNEKYEQSLELIFPRI